MALRDTNPLIDSDLELIITTFEKSMVKSRDVDSVLVPFRRDLVALANYPESVIASIDTVPIPSEVEESTGGTSNAGTVVPGAVLDNAPPNIPPPPPSVVTPEQSKGEATTPTEDGDDDEEWTDKIKELIAECVPCAGEFKRTIAAINADFFKDIGLEWDRALNESLGKLGDLESLLEDSDVTLAFCDLGATLKGNCGPDIKKMIFILGSLLGRMEIEFSLDLGILDSFLMSALSPIFNQLAANLDLIDTLAIDPIRCVLDYIQYQINHGPEIASEARAAIIDPVRRQAFEERARIQVMLRRRSQGQGIPRGDERQRAESEIAAERAKLEEKRRQILEDQGKRMKSALDRANRAFDRAQQSVNFLDKFQEYIVTGVEFLEDKKDWLLSLIEEFVNSGLDRWNDKMQFASTKIDILTFISIMKAMIGAIQNGDLACGPDSDPMAREDVAKIIRHWQHPSESLEIVVEDGNIITRRRPSVPSTGEVADQAEEDAARAATQEDAGDITRITTGGEGPGPDGYTETLSNVVVRRPISSCLKKVTTDEAEQVHQWIRQLEQEV